MGRYAAKKRQEDEAKRKKHEAEIAAKREKINKERKEGKGSNIPKKEAEAPVNKEATKKGNERMAKEKAAKEKAAKEAGAVEREENEWGPGGQPSASKQIAAKKKSTPKKSNVFTRHYKTGKELGVMTRSQRRAYDKEAHEAGGKSYEERVTAHEKETGHGKKHKRETLYNAAQRKKKNKKQEVMYGQI